jgi:hypothetical protein
MVCFGSEVIVSEQSGDWKEPRVRSLYLMAKISGNGPVHREVLAILGVMKRTERKDAERALDALRKKRSDYRHYSGTSTLQQHKGFKT